MSDRVLVMRGGAIVAEFDRAEATPDAVGAAMTAAGAVEMASSTTASQAIPRTRRWATVIEANGQELVVLAVIVVLFAVVAVINPRFSSDTNLTSIFSGNAYVAVAAIGMSLVIISGNIDVSVGSLIGVLATISGTLAVNGYPINRLLAGPSGGRHRHQRLRWCAGCLYAHSLDRGDARHAVGR